MAGAGRFGGAVADLRDGGDRRAPALPALGRDEASATGEVVRLLEERGATVLVHVCRVEYRFRDALGREVSGRVKTRNPCQWLFYCGAPLAVRYDPMRPERNTLCNI